MSEVLFTAQRDSQLNAVSNVHDILPTLTLKVVLYNVRARTGEHETSQENISVRSSFLFVFSLKEKKKVLENTISVQKCAVLNLDCKSDFFFARIYCFFVCLSFVLSQC